MHSRQLDMDALPAGTYLNTGEAARNGLTINRFCYDLRHPENRAAFTENPEACMEKANLVPEDRVLIRKRDWLGLVRRGANVFVLLRLAQLCGDGLTETGAQMRGETLAEYLASRATHRGG